VQYHERLDELKRGAGKSSESGVGEY
jgi:hypothetical protein